MQHFRPYFRSFTTVFTLFAHLEDVIFVGPIIHFDCVQCTDTYLPVGMTLTDTVKTRVEENANLLKRALDGLKSAHQQDTQAAVFETLYAVVLDQYGFPFQW